MNTIVVLYKTKKSQNTVNTQTLTYNILPNCIVKYLLSNISIIFHLHLFVSIFCDM